MDSKFLHFYCLLEDFNHLFFLILILLCCWPEVPETRSDTRFVYQILAFMMTRTMMTNLKSKEIEDCVYHKLTSNINPIADEFRNDPRNPKFKAKNVEQK